MSPQGVVTRKKVRYNPGLNSIEGHKICPGTWTRSRYKLSCLPLDITKNSQLGPRAGWEANDRAFLVNLV